MGRIHEHQRQVHTLDFNPNGGHLLLSGSQDSSIRLWDMRINHREPAGISWFSTKRFPGNSEGVRHVKWSPTDVFHFACATDSGAIQKWDIRKDTGPLLRITAHTKMCTAIDFHPDGIHVVSGSADKTVKVWDFSGTEKRQKPNWSIGAPHGVTKVCWRPPAWSSKSKASGSWDTTQLVTAYNQPDPRVHIWDFRRPNVPFREIDKYPTAPTSLLWHSEDLLWTAGLEGMFTQTDVHFAPKLFDRRPLQAFDSTPAGDFTFLAQRRPRRRGSGLDAHAAMLSISGSGRDGESGEKLSSSKSATDDSADDSYETGFFGSSFRKRQKQPSNTKSPSKSQASTPPSASNLLATQLGETLIHKSHFRPNQRGTANMSLASLGPEDYAFLATNYRQNLMETTASRATGMPSELAFHHAASQCFQINAVLALRLHLYRLAQTWRILGQVLEFELEARAQHNRSERLGETIEANPLKRHFSSGLDRHKDSIAIAGNKSLISEKNEKSSTKIHQASGFSTPLAKSRSDLVNSVKGTEDSTKIKSSRPSQSEQPRKEDASSSEGRFDPDSPVEINRHSKTSILPVAIDQRGAAQTHQLPRRTTNGSSVSPSRHFKGLPTAHRATSSDGYSGLGSAPSRSFDIHTDSFDSGEMRIGRMSFEEEVVRPALYSEDSFESDITRALTQDRSSAEFEDGHPSTLDGSFQPSLESEQSGRVMVSKGIRRNSAAPSQDTEPRSVSSREVPTSKRPSTSEYVPDLESKNFILSDFLPTTSQPSPMPHLSLQSLVTALVPYLLGPVPSDTLTACAIITLLIPLFPDLLPPPICLHISQVQHDNLVNRELFTSATSLRKLLLPLGPTFQSIWYTYTADVALTFSCLVCGKALKDDHRKCSKCKARVLNCMICGDSRSSKGLKLRDWCQSCSHGGHVRCVEEWFGDENTSLGGCAVMGCMCDCRPGQRRESKIQKMIDAKEKRKKESQKKYGSPRLLGEDIRGERRGSLPLIKDLKSERGAPGRRSMAGPAMDSRLRKEMNSKAVTRDIWDVEESRAVNRATGNLRLGLSGRSVSPIKGDSML